MKLIFKLFRKAANDWLVVCALYAMVGSVYSRNWVAVAWQFIVILIVLAQNIQDAGNLLMLKLINLGVTQLTESANAHAKVCPLAQKAS